MPTSSTGTVERTPCVSLLTVNSNTPHLVYCTMCGLHFASFHSDTLKLCRFREIGNGCWSRHLRLYKTHIIFMSITYISLPLIFLEPKFFLRIVSGRHALFRNWLTSTEKSSLIPWVWLIVLLALSDYGFSLSHLAAPSQFSWPLEPSHKLFHST